MNPIINGVIVHLEQVEELENKIKDLQLERDEYKKRCELFEQFLKVKRITYIYCNGQCKPKKIGHSIGYIGLGEGDYWFPADGYEKYGRMCFVCHKGFCRECIFNGECYLIKSAFPRKIYRCKFCDANPDND